MSRWGAPPSQIGKFTVSCDNWDLDCKELCAIECNARYNCDSFILQDDLCTLLSGCDVGSYDQSCGHDCQAYVCKDGCPGCDNLAPAAPRRCLSLIFWRRLIPTT